MAELFSPPQAATPTLRTTKVCFASNSLPGHALQCCMQGGVPKPVYSNDYQNATIPCWVLQQQNTCIAIIHSHTIQSGIQISFGHKIKAFTSCLVRKSNLTEKDAKRGHCSHENANLLAFSIKKGHCFKTCSTKWDEACTNTTMELEH